MRLAPFLPPTLLLLLALACQNATEELDAPRDERSGVASAAREADVDPPMVLTSKAYEAAGSLPLELQAPEEYPGLHNVFRLSEHIVSGSEPHGEEALETIARMGVRTIVSVDGKVPDAELAARHGMRYVHIPIQYKAITEDELFRLAKTFRELDGPFFVHCFHGKHRGPAAAAVGRIVLDDCTRETAIAEMRQWMGTSGKYEGLYRTIASSRIPTTAQTKDYAFDFPAAHRATGMRGAMVAMSRPFDALKLLRDLEWTKDPENPDLDVVNEGEKLVQAIRDVFALEGLAAEPADFREWMDESATASEELLRELRRMKAGEAGATASVNASLERLSTLCLACHDVHRN